jgi:hypothetical protein
MKLFTMLLTIQRHADIHALLMMTNIIIDRRSKQDKYRIITRQRQEKQQITASNKHRQIGR